MSRITRSMGTSRVPILLALLLGAATFVGMLAWLPTVGGDAPPAVSTANVLVAANDLAAGASVTGDRVRVVQMPVESIAQGALASLADADGRVLRYPVAAGEQLLTSKFVGEGQPASSGLAFVIPPGMRAVSVPISEITGAGGLIVPGDRVDVLAAVAVGRVAGATTASTEPEAIGIRNYDAVVTVLQDALVLAVGQAVSEASAVARDAGAQRADEADAQPKAASVTLAVTPAEAQTLFMAVNEGAIGLSLRPFGDTSAVDLAPVREFTSATEAAQVATR